MHAVMAALADLPMAQASQLPFTVRERVEKFRNDSIDQQHRNDSPQWSTQRNDARSNPGRLVEPGKRVTFNSGAQKGACTAFLKGVCNRGAACNWSHDWDVIEAEYDRIAENIKTQRAQRKSNKVAAIGSTNSQQTNHAARRAGESADDSQED